MRPNLKWSDGQPLTSADVSFGIKVYSDPTYGDKQSFPASEIASVDTPDPITVVIHLNKIDVAFLTLALTDPLVIAQAGVYLIPSALPLYLRHLGAAPVHIGVEVAGLLINRWGPLRLLLGGIMCYLVGIDGMLLVPSEGSIAACRALHVAGVVLVRWNLNHRSDERASAGTAYHSVDAKKLIPFRGSRLSRNFAALRILCEKHHTADVVCSIMQANRNSPVGPNHVVCSYPFARIH